MQSRYRSLKCRRILSLCDFEILSLIYLSYRERADVFLHAADLCAGKYRMKLNAATMLGQGKNIVQAEIDSACELVDFFRFNAKFALELEKYQPISLKNVTNTMVLR